MNFHQKHVTGARSVSPQHLVQMHYDDANCDKDKAAPALVAAARHTPALLDYLLLIGAKAALGNVRHSDNSRIYSGSASADTPRYSAASTTALAAVQRRALATGHRNIRILLDAILPNGVRMSAARVADLDDAIATYEPQARDMTAKVAYFRLVRAKIDGDATVGDALGNEDLTILFEQAKIPA